MKKVLVMMGKLVAFLMKNNLLIIKNISLLMINFFTK